MIYNDDTREKVADAIRTVLYENIDCDCEKELNGLIAKALNELITQKPNLNANPPEVIMVG